jgi:two-component system phosphate regulon sensor histidine kinase PhoR
MDLLQLFSWRRKRRRIPSSQVLLQWIDASPLGWVLLEPNGRVSHVNPAAEKLLGLEGWQPLRGRRMEDLCDDRNLASIISLGRRHGRVQRQEWRFRLRDYDLMVMPASEGWIGIQFQSRRSLEAQLEQQERWVGDVAHELKTPLTALLLVGESLAAQVNSQNERLVERLQRELLRLREMVEDLLELSRLENRLPGNGMKLGPVALTPLVEQVWSILRPLADQRQIGLRIQNGMGVILQGDASRLHRALLNLVDNAVRFSPDGQDVEVTLASRSGWCRVSVRDHGPGLSEDDLRHMFKRFYRGDPSRVRSQRTGSGLGLAIVQQIAVTHGGRIQASNHPEGGALMELILPVMVAQPA